jgi:predicted ATPase/class 3 adenylate cyclase
VTDACPPDKELALLLIGGKLPAEWSALEAHVAGCAACQKRLVQLNQGGLTLPAWASDLKSGREYVPPYGTELEGPADSLPFRIPPSARHAAPERKIDATFHPTSLSSPGASTPIPEHRATALPGPVHGQEKPATVPQPTLNVTPQLAFAPPTAQSRPDASPSTPAFFGRYQVQRGLGAGGFGTVYLGYDSQLDRSVAIKVLHAGTGLPRSEVERFLQEARRLARLRHPGIVAVHDVGMQEGQIFLVSDYLDGPDLGHWLKDNRPTWPEAARITAAVADALAHAHARLIVHRDVKPANILLTADRVPVLVDFGIALDDVQAGGSERGIISGTPWYMSPEQAEGTAHRIDGRTDVYSLGVVLYELLTGRVPFRAVSPLEMLRQVRDDEPQPPRQLARDVPSELERACLKAMAKRQQDRYTTAADFADDLRRILQTTTEASALRPVSTDTLAGESRETTPATIRPDTLAPGSFRGLAREAERRQVTVLVAGCDLFESEEFLGLDTEDQARILRAFQEVCEQAARSFDGTVVQCNEQGLLACFGYPVAYEDAVHRAARAGFKLLDDAKTLGKELRHAHNLEPSPRVSLHTGLAIVEAKENSVSLVGDARIVAVRLQETSAPGQVTCTEATHRLFQGQFQCASLGPRKIKGVARAVQLFRVERVAAAGSLIEAVATADLSPLTGRDNEISLLKDRWEQAQEGMGHVVLLVGEPGLGKSRLVRALKEHVPSQMVEGEVDAPVIEWRCSPHRQNTGLYPAIDFYERALGFRPEEPPRDRFERMLSRVAEYELARPEIVPLWSSLLSLPTPDRFPRLSSSPARQREETFRLLLEWLQVRANRGPILFIVEDLHWADASTLEFLGQILSELRHHRILILLTFRTEFKPPWTPVDHQTRLALTRLTRRQVGDLMRKKAGDSLPDAVIEQVYDRAGGVPLFVEEFTKMMRESAMLEQQGGGSAPGSSLLGHEIPSTLQDLVMARLDRMEGGRELAQLAAVLGREFSHDLLVAVADVDEPTLQAELAELARAEILFPKGRPPRCTYIFKHALLEDALYNALVKARRQQLHRRIGEVLEATFSRTVETQPELLGHHFAEAGLAEKAIGYWLKAGQRSLERSAHREAIGHLTNGLALLNTLEETRERDARELQILTALGPAYIAARGYAAPEAGPILLRARELCQRIGNSQQLFGILLGMWEWRLVRGDLRLCVDLAADGMALAERLNDPGILMEALFMPGATRFYRAEFANARVCYEKALAAYDDRERTRFWTAYTGHNASVTHRCYLALVLWHLGYPDQALKVDREMREVARAIGHAFSLGHAVDFTAFLYHCCRLGGEVQVAAREEMAIGAEQGFQLWHALGTLHSGAAMLLRDQREEALLLLQKGFSAFRATGAEVRVPTYLAMLGDAYTRSARFEEAHGAINEGLAVVEKNDDRCHEAELHRLKGELLLAEAPDQFASAEDSFRLAIEIAQRQQSKGWELRATMSLARLWQRQGRVDDARGALATVYGTYTEGFTTPDLVDAKAMLQALV